MDHQGTLSNLLPFGASQPAGALAELEALVPCGLPHAHNRHAHRAAWLAARHATTLRSMPPCLGALRASGLASRFEFRPPPPPPPPPPPWSRGGSVRTNAEVTDAAGPSPSDRSPPNPPAPVPPTGVLSETSSWFRTRRRQRHGRASGAGTVAGHRRVVRRVARWARTAAAGGAAAWEGRRALTDGLTSGRSTSAALTLGLDWWFGRTTAPGAPHTYEHPGRGLRPPPISPYRREQHLRGGGAKGHAVHRSGRARAR
eukprot:353298-Chlamydomonas_euryale.AAC.1